MYTCSQVYSGKNFFSSLCFLLSPCEVVGTLDSEHSWGSWASSSEPGELTDLGEPNLPPKADGVTVVSVHLYRREAASVSLTVRTEALLR